MMILSSGTKVALRGRVDGDFSAGESFGDVVVGVAFELDEDAGGEPGGEGLAGGAVEAEVDGVVGQALGAEAAWRFRG